MARVIRTSLLCAALVATILPIHAADVARAFDPGGAVRFSYGWLDYGPSTGFDPELVRLDARGTVGRFDYSAQYRWYDGFDAIHHAWAGWRPDDANHLRVGVQQVPFGLLPQASHSFWFGSGYYLGIEDDYDPGVVWQHDSGTRVVHLGVFAGDEYGTGARYDRYSFDVATTDALPYRERERVVARYEHTGAWRGGVLATGISAFAGHVQRRDNDSRHAHQAAGMHARWTRGPATVELQWARYRYAVDGPRIAMSAFMAPFEIAAEADVPSVNVAWALQRTGWFDAVTCYNNLSATLPVRDDPGLRDSWQNVTGCSFAKGPMLTYVDWIAGRNMWFAGGAGIGIDEPGSDRWRSRLNINVGFYF
ncbi:hypothetical protein [Luteimonas yindakuii]|uniref:hypothetical protein n=1 Tax=Luteimonas yindakuii TaxID=2565782 RepID=UPI001FB57849|nr:hypothetical protein [Luteimonas yindakuii]